MRIDRILPQPLARAAATQGWRVGQVLLARVEGEEEGWTLLRIGTGLFRAEGARGLAPGTELTLEVRATGPQPLLRVLPRPDPTGLAAALARASLPHQVPLNEALGRIARLLTSGGPSTALRSAAEAVLALVPPASGLTAEAMRTAVLRAGTLLEARLGAAARGAAPPPGDDLKGALLRLAAQAPDGEMAEAVEGALARIESLQSASLARPGEPPALVVELPLRRDDGGLDRVLLRFEREDAGPATGKPRGWAVTLELELDGLGLLWARIALAGGRVGVTLWAERAPVRARLAATAAQLAEALAAAGLDPGTVRLAEETPSAARPRPPGPLVDEEA